MTKSEITQYQNCQNKWYDHGTGDCSECGVNHYHAQNALQQTIARQRRTELGLPAPAPKKRPDCVSHGITATKLVNGKIVELTWKPDEYTSYSQVTDLLPDELDMGYLNYGLNTRSRNVK